MKACASEHNSRAPKLIPRKTEGAKKTNGYKKNIFKIFFSKILGPGWAAGTGAAHSSLTFAMSNETDPVQFKRNLKLVVDSLTQRAFVFCATCTA